MQDFKTTVFFNSAQRHNHICIFMKHQLYVLIANYVDSAHLMAFSLCLLNLELTIKENRFGKDLSGFWSDLKRLTPRFCGGCGRKGFCAHGFMEYLWMPMQRYILPFPKL